MCEIERLILSQALVVLRNHDFELIALRDNQLSVRFWADANPINACQYGQRAVGFNRDCKTRAMQRVDQCIVELQHRLAARADDKRRASCGGHSAAIIAASASAVLYLPPFSPSSPTKSVSQKRHIAPARSSSRPDHRLHPANRQNTAGRPAFAPSPCNV